jgi:hypothetical protein
MPDVGAIRKKLLFKFCENFLRCAGMLRQWFSKKFRQCGWFDVWEHGPFFDVLQISGQQVHDSVSNFAKFCRVHVST